MSDIISAPGGIASPALWTLLAGPLANVLAAFIAALVVMLQLRGQSRNTLRQNRKSEEIKLRLAIYESYSAAITKFQDCATELRTFLLLLSQELDMLVRCYSLGAKPRPTSMRTPRLLELDRQYGRARSEVIEIVEKWMIIDPRLQVFVTAFVANGYDSAKMFGQLFPEVMSILPTDMPGGTTVPSMVIDPRRIDQAAYSAKRLWEITGTAEAYGVDLQRETQELLLSELFPNRVPRRAPLTGHALTLAKAEELIRHFETETEWGVSAANVERDLSAARHADS